MMAGAFRCPTLAGYQTWTCEITKLIKTEDCPKALSASLINSQSLSDSNVVPGHAWLPLERVSQNPRDPNAPQATAKRAAMTLLSQLAAQLLTEQEEEKLLRKGYTSHNHPLLFYSHECKTCCAPYAMPEYKQDKATRPRSSKTLK